MPEPVFLKKLQQRKVAPRWKQQPRKPNDFLYFAASGLAGFYFKSRYGFTYDNRAVRDIQEPVIVICNHQSNIDFLMVAAALYPLKLNFIVSSFFFRNRTLKYLLKLMGCIPKKQFVPDVGAIKSTMKVVARGDSVAIFPEGQVCYAGQNCAIDPSIGKLVKKLGVTTINVKLRGNHLTCPKWDNGKHLYRGAVDCVAEVLFRADELEKLSLSEITERTVRALAYDEFEWQRARNVQYKPVPRSPRGLEYIVYNCPSCRAPFAMSSTDDALTCTKCGFSVVFDEHGFFKSNSDHPLVYDNYAAWYRAQQQEIKERFSAPAFSCSCACTLLKYPQNTKGYTPCGEGTLTLDQAGIRYEGTCDGQPFSLYVSYDQQSGLTHSADFWCIDVGAGDTFYGFQPEERRAMLYYIEIFNLRRGMTNQ